MAPAAALVAGSAGCPHGASSPAFPIGSPPGSRGGGMVRFEQLTAVVTGGGQGIGAATCRLLAGEGARVAVLDLDFGA
ncbi:MAG: SDR family NAD(P)-dependent oxidoreductase, partial [Candidatus Dormibacteria bacterium]